MLTEVVLLVSLYLSFSLSQTDILELSCYNIFKPLAAALVLSQGPLAAEASARAAFMSALTPRSTSRHGHGASSDQATGNVGVSAAVQRNRRRYWEEHLKILKRRFDDFATKIPSEEGRKGKGKESNSGGGASKLILTCNGGKGTGKPVINPEKFIWVGGLPDGTSESDFKEVAQQVGGIESLVFKSGKSGRISFTSKADATAAISALNGAVVNGTRIQADVWSKKDPEKGNGKGKDKGKGSDKGGSDKGSWGKGFSSCDNVGNKWRKSGGGWDKGWDKGSAEETMPPSRLRSVAMSLIIRASNRSEWTAKTYAGAPFAEDSRREQALPPVTSRNSAVMPCWSKNTFCTMKKRPADASPCSAAESLRRGGVDAEADPATGSQQGQGAHHAQQTSLAAPWMN